jgi:hypothetical protein
MAVTVASLNQEQIQVLNGTAISSMVQEWHMKWRLLYIPTTLFRFTVLSQLVSIISLFRGGRKDKFPKNPAAVIFKIKAGQRVFGDFGYEGEPEKVAIMREGDSIKVKKFKSRAKAGHESFNGRLKSFQILDLAFRHGFGQHQMACEPVCTLCQYDMENGPWIDGNVRRNRTM